MVAQPEGEIIMNYQLYVDQFVDHLNIQIPKDTARLESIVQMIDTWSIAHSILLVIVSFTQVYFLKKFFEESPTTTKLNARI